METQQQVAEYMDPETAFLASKQETGHEWELFKENVRPLKRGRNVRLLNDALKSNTDCHLKKSLLETRRKLIEAIDEYKGEDPLQPWTECIKWIQEAFPPGGDSSGLVLIYEQCVRAFWHEERYKNDYRYLKIWLEYAENCFDAEVIYSFLEANKIGLTHASFYIAYAKQMESKNKIRTANEIFNRGISCDAQPSEKLKMAYRKFLTRSMRAPKATEEDPTESQAPVRSFGTVLARLDENQDMGSSDNARKRLKQTRSQGTSLSIYKDGNPGFASSQRLETSKPDSKLWNNLGARAERNKENNALPSRWTSHKIPQRPGHGIGGRTQATCIEIFVDEECAEVHKGDNEEGKSSILQLRRGDERNIKRETELLRENPLRNFPSTSLPR